MLHKLFETIELAFWKIAIPLMTHSNTVRAIIRTFYKIHIDQRLKKDIVLSIVVSCAGFVFGAAIYSLFRLLA
jgi:hypothetical protein